MSSGLVSRDGRIGSRRHEANLPRLKGHRGPITSIKFIPHPTLSTTAHPGYLLTTSRDTYLKLWDLSTQHCVQTVVVGRGEVWSCAVQEQEGKDGDEEVDEEDEEKVTGSWTIITGSGDGEGKVWVIEKAELARGMAENAKGEVGFVFKQAH
jgi:U3 small nucleolar RNA-associated protein 12